MTVSNPTTKMSVFVWATRFIRIYKDFRRWHQSRATSFIEAIKYAGDLTYPEE